MVVEGQVNIIVVAEPFNGVQRFQGRFGDEGLDSHLSGEFEHLSAAVLITGNDGVEAGQHAYAGIIHFDTDGFQFFIGQVGIEVLINAATYLLEVQTAHIGDAEFVRLIYGFKKRIFVKGVGNDTQMPSELFLRLDGGRQAGARDGGHFQVAQSKLGRCQVKL
ncbi:MAG: hypothetical protein BWY09_00299 [Candidatus Hydrogenedentes bacterium ADurb.Bin179]|nr:MAG: hypothetical protein BWY09_00299 [Candidatus Hydrogenedentes bacterium ADurb.Bin179]